jgi:hypothetical protein
MKFGMMEYWSSGVLGPIAAIIPSLQYSKALRGDVHA